MNINTTNHKFVKMVEKKYGLSCFGTGVEAPSTIKSFLLSFYVKGDYSIDQARELMINITEDLINLVKDPKVIENLENPPFDSKNLKITIMFDDKNDNLQKDLSLVRMSDNIIYFKREISDYNFVDITKEPYSEAYFKVRGTYPPPRS